MQRIMQQPGVEPGPLAWKARILPLDYCSDSYAKNVVLTPFAYMMLVVCKETFWWPTNLVSEDVSPSVEQADT